MDRGDLSVAQLTNTLRGRLTWWGVLGLLVLALLTPLTLVDVPPLLDYPNHLARAVVLAFGASDPILSRIYAAHWTIIPDLGIDLTLPLLLHVLPVHVAGRVLIGSALMLPVLGTLAYSRAVFGVRSAWPFASALVAYNGTLLLGFLNFVAGLGLALLFASAWIVWRDRHPLSTVAAAMVATVVLFFCHLMGLVFWVILIGGYETAWIWRHRGAMAAVARRVGTAVSVLVAPLALYALSPLSPVSTATAWPTMDNKLRELVMPFANYLLPLDIATIGPCHGFLSVCVFAGRCRVTVSSGVPLVVVTVLFLAAPNALKGTYLFDTRFAVMFGFLLFGAVLPGRCQAVHHHGDAGLHALFVARMALWVWHGGASARLVDLRDTIASVPPGARVFLAMVSHEEAPEYWQRGP